MNTDAITIKYGTSGVLSTDDFVDDGFTLEDYLCSESQITFGACESAAVEVSIASTAASFVGQTLEVYLGNTLLGKYKVTSDERSSDGETRVLTAYDALYDINGKDVTDWYNGIDWTSVTDLEQFRNSFFNYLGITQVSTTLINDKMAVKKTMDTTSCSGATILKAICEINGVLGHINANGQFEYVELSTGTATSVTEDEVLDTTTEDFTVSAFDSVLIRTEDGDVGGQYPTTGGDNQYIITGNFLCYGKESADLQTIAQNALSKIGSRAYTPYEAELECQGNISLGSKVSIPTDPATITSYVLQRKLVGIEGLTEYFGAQGTAEYTPDANSTRNQTIATAQRMNKLTTTLDGTISRVEDIEEDYITSSDLEQTEKEISAKVSIMDGDTTTNCSWSLKPEAFTVSSNGNEVLKVDGSGLTVNGSGTFSGSITSSSATITGGSVHIDTDTASDSKISLSKKVNDKTYCGIEIAPGELRIKSNYNETTKVWQDDSLILSNAQMQFNTADGHTVDLTVKDNNGVEIWCDSDNDVDLNGFVHAYPDNLALGDEEAQAKLLTDTYGRLYIKQNGFDSEQKGQVAKFGLDGTVIGTTSGTVEITGEDGVTIKNGYDADLTFSNDSKGTLWAADKLLVSSEDLVLNGNREDAQIEIKENGDVVIEGDPVKINSLSALQITTEDDQDIDIKAGGEGVVNISTGTDGGVNITGDQGVVISATGDNIELNCSKTGDINIKGETINFNGKSIIVPDEYELNIASGESGDDFDIENYHEMIITGRVEDYGDILTFYIPLDWVGIHSFQACGMRSNGTMAKLVVTVAHNQGSNAISISCSGTNLGSGASLEYMRLKA